jgi:hypothetical protein
VMCVQPSGCSRDGLHALAAIRDVNVVIADDNAPSVAIRGGSLVAGGWRRGVQEAVVDASDAVGVRGTAALVDGRPKHEITHTCDDTRSAPCPNGRDTLQLDTRGLSDGRHVLSVTATDSAGNAAGAQRAVNIDNTAPLRPVALRVDGASGWRSKNGFTLRWSNARQSGAPVTGARVAVCPAAHTSPDLSTCLTQFRAGSGLSTVEGVRVPVTGEWRARVWLRDDAGNENPTAFAETTLRFDDQPPSLAFAPPTVDQPTRVRVRVRDIGGGLASREVLLRRRGANEWTSLKASPEREGFSTVIDDEHLRDGIYDLRARAVDLAGNERSTDRLTDGRRAELALPLRIKTRLVVGKPKRVRAIGARGKRRYRIVLIGKPRSRFGRTIPLRGRLTSPGGNPLVGRNIQVLEQTHLRAAPWRPIATLRTSRTGRFTFKALRGPSRTLRFRFGGTDTIRGRTAEVRLGVRAATTMTVDRIRVVNGDGVTFRGRLQGRPYPASGKLVEVQARARGRWVTFGTTRAHARTGRWSFPYRFSATRGTVQYRFRARVPRDSGYPYETGTSPAVAVGVRGL